MIEPRGAPQPAVTIYRLTAGFVVYLDNGNTVGCTNIRTLSRAIRNYLGEPTPFVVQPPNPQKSSQMAENVEVAPSNLTVQPTEVSQQILQTPQDASGTINPLLAAENLRVLCQAYVEGKLTPDQWEQGLTVACPGISLREAKLTLAAYTGTPEPPAHRAAPVRDEADHYKMAPEIDKPWEEHDSVTVLDLIDDVPTATVVPNIGVIENGTAQPAKATEEGEVKTELPAYAEDWMVQEL